MTYAILETGGKQLWAEPGRFYDVELVEAEPDTEVLLDQVLLINHDGQVTVGHPYVAGAVVKTRVLMHRKAAKVLVYKMRPKKKTRKKNGHRQRLTRILIESIELKGTVLAAAEFSPTTADTELVAVE
jgi:large subunit ribosomal protein L21